MKTYGFIFLAIAVGGLIGSFTVEHDAPLIIAVICGLFAAYLLNEVYSYRTNKTQSKWNNKRK